MWWSGSILPAPRTSTAAAWPRPRRWAWACSGLSRWARWARCARPAVQLEVRPKERLGLGRLLFLLGYAGDQGFRDDSVAAVEETGSVERAGRIPGATCRPCAEPRGAAGLPDCGGIAPDGQGPDPDLGPDLPPPRHAGPAGGLLRRVHRGHCRKPDPARRAGADVPGAAGASRSPQPAAAAEGKARRRDPPSVWRAAAAVAAPAG